MCCVLGGMIIAFIYDVFRVRRKVIETGNILVYFEDFIYWIIVALVLFAVVYYSNEGEIRGYLIIGTVLGIILYAVLLSKIVMKLFVHFIKFIYKIVVTILGIILFPAKIIYKTCMVPAKIIYKNIKRVFLKTKKLSKINIEKFTGFKRIIKIIRKKI
ncbi:spore cortex biosynthesis protein YabQ [Herbivorax sp. ANBcel31]|nr:spore cortex biosynthesis protein YabQ [Herbivorax sp. ANBcel31]MDQ2086529.1 spore cortex biosynthesis protein YabQ [Herbivorax sp. ANBcel31]